MLKGKTALVTGSTSGIGLGIATRLAAEGANVVLNGFGDASQIESLRKDLARKNGVEVAYEAADMTKPEAIRAMVEKAAAFHTTRAALPGMKKKGWGRIVNIASAHALVASPFKAAYVSAKHGLAGLTKTVALEVAQQGITANAICPGYVRTPLVEKQIPDTAKARGISEEAVVRDVILAAQPTKQFVKVEEVAALAAYLCSDAAAAITGALLSIDGGWTAA